MSREVNALDTDEDHVTRVLEKGTLSNKLPRDTLRSMVYLLAQKVTMLQERVGQTESIQRSASQWQAQYEAQVQATKDAARQRNALEAALDAARTQLREACVKYTEQATELDSLWARLTSSERTVDELGRMIEGLLEARDAHAELSRAAMRAAAADEKLQYLGVCTGDEED